MYDAVPHPTPIHTSRQLLYTCWEGLVLGRARAHHQTSSAQSCCTKLESACRCTLMYGGIRMLMYGDSMYGLSNVQKVYTTLRGTHGGSSTFGCSTQNRRYQNVYETSATELIYNCAARTVCMC